jgi:hypothetical protein
MISPIADYIKELPLALDPAAGAHEDLGCGAR